MVCCPKSSLDLEMEGGFKGGKNGFLYKNCSKLLEAAATDDLASFIQEVEKGCDVNEGSFWYGRSFGSKKMGFEERSPIMIASLYGSTEVLKYIIESCKVDVNKACGSDGATALHCAAAGGSWSSVEVVKLLIGASGDVNAVDADGKKPGDLIAPCVKSSTSLKRKTLEMLLNGSMIEGGGDDEGKMGNMEKKEYPIDVSLPDINNGVYGSDEFRMYNFKVQPCSRAYSHDWTECPFVHPGENARRRDPRKYSYTCVPCPEFKKGTCGKGDGCEYAHGVFESWLHPAQYRTRLCKDEIGCSRKVCFFAHKPQELRPLYASTGSAIPSPKSVALDSTMMSPLSLGSTPPMSPGWQSKTSSLTPPALHLPGSRLKSTLTARDFEMDLKMEMNLKPTNLDDFFGSLDPIRQNTSHLRASYPSNATYGFDSSAAVAAAMMNSRSTAFAKRSQSFVDRGGVSYRPGMSVSPNSPSPMMPSKLSNWGSPDGKLDWGFNGEDASKLRKSASFGFRTAPTRGIDEPDVSWVNTLVKDVPAQKKHGGVHEMMPLWVDQMYMEQEQMVA